MRLRVSPGAVRAFAVPAIRALAATWRIRTEHEERWRELFLAGRPHVFLLWHEALLPLLWQHRGQGIAIVVSEAALSFVGLGPRDGVSLGAVMDQGVAAMLRAPHVLVVGALAIFVTSASMLIAGRAAGARAEPAP